MSRGIARWLCLLLALVALPAFAQTRAWLDRAEITYGETVALNIATDQSIAQIDYGPLRAQFDLGGQSVRRSFELANGRSRTVSVFSVGLRPRAPGLASIPALRVGNASTAPLRLVVLEPTVQPAGANADVFVETDVDAARPYVQQAVGVTVRLNYAIPLMSGQLDLDAPAHASLQRVGEDIQYQRMLDGRRYNVVERRFLLIPERSGPLLLPGARLNGVTGSGFMGFDGERQPVSAAAPAKRLQVLPIPANVPQPWLPLHGLTLRYLQAPKQAFAGEAASVQIEAVADGATAAQMPEIGIADVPGAQVFAEPAQVDEQFVEGRPRTTVRRTFSLVPARPGALVVAGPRIAWWDAANGVARVAELPPLQMQVAPGAHADAAPDPASPAAQPTHDLEPTAPQSAASHASGAREWRGMLLGLLALMAAALIAFLWWRRRDATRAVTKETPAAPSTPGVSLASALKAGDLAAIAHALAKDAGLATDDLDALRARLADSAQVDALHQLQAARWGGGDVQAALRALRAAFAGGARWRQTKQKAESLLPPLYPE
ncbi:BatD family protein [Thermomonas brevis]|uniref:BatD family protein n=1 Tax=Thermomonas brevis TaxID=215691 RepID=A0A7G9QWI6_9GAMM|nr:BatD family protein [Thermomonas brevis]QNN47711.1 BatD family protein [Thermomonas brevis]